MEFAAVSVIINIALAFVMFLMKQVLGHTQESIRALQHKQDRFQEDYLKKEDFREFKDELWERMDDLKVEIRTMRSK